MVKTINIKNISYGSLKLLKECESCFWWHIKHGISRQNAWQSQLPNTIEARILEKFYDYRMSGKLPPELNIPEIESFRLIDHETHNKWKNPRSGEPTFQNLDANPDDVLTDGHKLIVLDIKTASKSPENCTEENFRKDIEKYEYKLQLEFYNYILRKLGYKTEDFGYILFYYIKDMDNQNNLKMEHKLIKVEIEVKNVTPLLKEAEKVLKNNKFPKSRCEFCSSNLERYKNKSKKQEESQNNVEEMMKEVYGL